MAFDRRNLPVRRIAAALLMLASGLAAGAQDPTAPPAAAASDSRASNPETVERPDVRAILWSGDRRIAFVGDGYVREGDDVAYGRVQRIDRHAVVFRRDESLVHVPVTGHGIKQNHREQP